MLSAARSEQSDESKPKHPEDVNHHKYSVREFSRDDYILEYSLCSPSCPLWLTSWLLPYIKADRRSCRNALSRCGRLPHDDP